MKSHLLRDFLPLKSKIRARSEASAEGTKALLFREESLTEKLYNVKSLPGLKLVTIDREITPGRMSAECDDQRRGWRAAVAGACALTLLFAAAANGKSSASKMLESFDSGPDPDAPGGCVYYYIQTNTWMQIRIYI